MKLLVRSHWVFILLSLLVATVGWGLKVRSNSLADVCIISGTGLVVAFCAIALQRQARRLNLSIMGPLALFGLGVGVLAAENMVLLPDWSSLPLRMLGESLPALAALWFLFRLNRVWDRKVVALRRLQRSR